MSTNIPETTLPAQETAQEMDVSAPDAAYERETTVVMSDGDPLVRINTMQRTVLTKLRKKPEVFTEIKSGFCGNFEWAEFTCPRNRFNLGAAARAPRELSDEQRAAMAERFRKIREANQ